MKWMYVCWVTWLLCMPAPVWSGNEVEVILQANDGIISGRLRTEDNEAVDFATVYLKGTQYGCISGEKGTFRLVAPAGRYVLVVSSVGFQLVEKPIVLKKGEHLDLDILVREDVMQLDEVEVVSTGVSRVKRSAFNAVAVDAKELVNSTKNLSEALVKLPGMKLRESGGVGSDMQLVLDGFSGKHVKIFIDGVPQEGAGGAFSLNNIPVNFADRIEVYICGKRGHRAFAAGCACPKGGIGFAGQRAGDGDNRLLQSGKDLSSESLEIPSRFVIHRPLYGRGERGIRTCSFLCRYVQDASLDDGECPCR